MQSREKLAWIVLIVVVTLYLREAFIPTPGPGPNPPGPDPDPPPTPTAPFQVPTSDLYVLITEETTERPRLPAQQLLIFTSTAVREWLDSNTKWRLLDQNAPMNNDDKVWQDAMKVPRQSLPWIAISNGKTKTGYSGPLPADSKATLELLGKYK
jgi:hypothetical protein